jgi:regulator of RNase E activity RraA
MSNICGVKKLGKDVLVERLGKLDSSAISDAMDSLQLEGVVNRLHSVTVPKKIFGRAVTVKLVPKGQTESKRHLCTAAIETAAKGDVIVIEHCRTDVAGWGGNLSIAAKEREISGVVIDGACRDADEMVDLDFPVYASAVVPTTARGRIVEHSYNQKITIGNIDVQPGDLVIADRSGIVFIPSSYAEKVITAAERIAEKEALMANLIREGNPVSKVMGKNYETMLEGSSN